MNTFPTNEPRSTAQKFGVLGAIVVLACAGSGLFGMLHNQVSYTVSPEYFSRFKFLQFGLLDPSVPERARAALIGFLASWWMGLPGGLFLGASAFVFPAAQMFGAAARALVAALFTAALFPLGALLWSLIWDPASVPLRPGYARPSVTNPIAFERAGAMHRAAYFGGVFGLAAGRFWMMRRRRASQRSQS